jgi:3-mercaptopyruvate sulfurtransferase SseA
VAGDHTVTRRRSVAILAGALLLTASAALRAQADDPTKVPRVTVAEFTTLLAKKAVLAIDVRDPHSFEAGHIPGAKNVSYVDVEIRANALRKQPLPIVAYCA